MRRVIVESPFAGDTDGNIKYARRCLADCLSRNESPLASHLLLTQPGVLDDSIPAERTKGINAGIEWHSAADAVIFYTDRGMSNGMKAALEDAKSLNLVIEFRDLDR